jgi:hypothetical protein
VSVPGIVNVVSGGTASVIVGSGNPVVVSVSDTVTLLSSGVLSIHNIATVLGMASFTDTLVLYTRDTVGISGIATVIGTSASDTVTLLTANIVRIRQLFPARALHHVPIGYVPALSRIPQAIRTDIDVLFYGSLSGRRSRILDGLQARGVRVERAFNVYGADLNLWPREQLGPSLGYLPQDVELFAGTVAENIAPFGCTG